MGKDYQIMIENYTRLTQALTSDDLGGEGLVQDVQRRFLK